MKASRAPRPLGVRSVTRLGGTRRADPSCLSTLTLPFIPMPNLIIYASHAGPPTPAEADLGHIGTAQSLVLPHTL